MAAGPAANLNPLFGLTNTTLTAFQKLVELNLQTMTSALTETDEPTRMAFCANDPQQLLVLHASLLQRTGEQAQSYCRQLFDIASAMQAEFAKVAEAQYEENKRKMQDVFDNAGKSAPAGSEAAMSAWQSAMAATTALYETMLQTTKQAVEVAESHRNIAASAAPNAGQQATREPARAAKQPSGSA